MYIIYIVLLISIDQISNYKSMDLLDVKCDSCQRVFKRRQFRLKSALKLNNQTKHYCSSKCQGIRRITKIKVECKQCGSEFFKVASQHRKHPNSFCNRSCFGTYNNTHKTHGCRISKLEKYLHQVLPEKYQDLEFHFNRKDVINSELDIYIPQLKLAFEINGIFHYEPIYGKEKLTKIQNNDNRKFQACLEHQIELCIIDTSELRYFKKEKAQKYLTIITNIIDLKLAST